MNKRLFIRFSIVLMMIFSFSKLKIGAQEINEIKKLANQYLDIGDFAEAESLNYRLLCFGNDSLKYEASKSLAEIYVNTNQLEKAVFYFREALSFCNSDSDLFYSYLTTLIRNKNYELAILELNSYNHKEKGKDRYFLYLGISHLLSDNHFNAQTYLDSLADVYNPNLKLQIDSLLSKQKYRNPKTAKVFSTFIPGSGQVYSGDIKNGSKAFVLNVSLLAITAYIGIEYGALQATFSSFPWFFRYYTSNIQKAALSAQNKNLQEKEKSFYYILGLLENQTTVSKISE